MGISGHLLIWNFNIGKIKYSFTMTFLYLGFKGEGNIIFQQYWMLKRFTFIGLKMLDKLFDILFKRDYYNMIYKKKWLPVLVTI